MNYISYTFAGFTSEDLKAMFMELLADVGFDSFMDVEEGLSAYCRESELKAEELAEVLSMEQFKDVKAVAKDVIPDKDWNAVWESSYKPVIINDICRIRAPFHSAEGCYKYDLLIEPRMSFGTAHHETTSQIIALMLDTDFNGRDVLDMGCGTAVLAILAKRLGSALTVAIDNDEWAYRNSIDNVKMNGIDDIIVEYGDASLLKDRKFDIILANINRNILLNDMPAYVGSLNPNGKIFFSGFYESDLPIIRAKAESLGLEYQRHVKKNEWTAAVFIKNKVIC